MLVAQDAPAVDVFAPDGNGWHATADADGTVAIPGINVTLALADLYEGVEPADPRAAGDA